VVCVADIHDGSVAVAIVALGTHPAVLALERASAPMTETSAPGHAQLAALLTETANKLIQAYSVSDVAKKFGQPQHVYAVFHSPWTHLRTAQAEESYEKPRTVTKELIASLVQKALTAPSQLGNTKLSSGVLHVYVNGYPSAKPIGKKGAKVGVIAYESDIDAEMQTATVAALQKVLPGRSVIARSAMRAFLAVMHEHMPDIPRYAVIDVGTMYTSSFVIRRENVSEESSVPEGVTTITKRLAGSGPPEEIIPLLRLIANDNCTTPACQALRESIARLEPELVKTYAELFAKLAAARRLPNAAVLFVADPYAEWMRNFFARIDFAQFTATTQPFTVDVMTADKLGHVQWSGKADAGIGVAATYVNMVEQTE